ncbi:MAG: YlxR family protein [Clostridia bacterium]|nr:YlxR family protein [Clostridia bacterium]
MKDRKVPMRKCVGCGVSKPKEELVRIAFFENELSLDLSGRAKGRGVYLCKGSKDCIDKAAKRKAIQRSFPGVKADDITKVLEEIYGKDI